MLYGYNKFISYDNLIKMSRYKIFCFKYIYIGNNICKIVV